MRAIYYKITNDLFFYNKNTLVFFCALPFIFSLIIPAINDFKINYFDIFSSFCSLASGVLVISQILKMNDFSFQKFSYDKDVYSLNSVKNKTQCYNETFKRILLNKITSENLHVGRNNDVSDFLSNLNSHFIEELKQNITFERFNEYLITNDSNKTSGNLFYTLYRNSLSKIVKDFIIQTDYLQCISDNMKQQFIHELTNLKNLKFDSIKGLHYDDKFVIDFLENNYNQESNEQKNSTPDEIKPIKLINISKPKFYDVLRNITIDILKVELTKENKNELKSFVGLFFKSDIESKFHFENQVKQLSFLNNYNSTDFILCIKYLIKVNIITNNMRGNMINLDKVIDEKAYNSTAKNRSEIFRLNIHLIDFPNEKRKNIDAILQNVKIKLN